MLGFSYIINRVVVFIIIVIFIVYDISFSVCVHYAFEILPLRFWLSADITLLGMGNTIQCLVLI